MTDLSRVETWLYHLGDVSDDRARAIGASNADLVVTEWANYRGGETPYTADLLDLMRGAEDKTILSYLSIGEAETYRYYWQQDWERPGGAPSWLGEENPEWEGNIKVRYWEPEWQDIVFDYAERIVNQGFDGLYLDIVSAYEHWERGNRAPGIDHRAEMATFVAGLREVIDTRAEEIGRTEPVRIIGQNALELISEPGYVAAIDGIAKEDLRFYYEYGAPQDFAEWAEDEYLYHRDLLAEAEDKGLATFVVEYVPEAAEAGAEAALEATARDLGKTGSPLFIARDRDLTQLPEQPAAVSLTGFPPFMAADGGPTAPPPPPPAPPPASGPTLRGTARDDLLRGTGESEVIKARGGDDRIRARGGDDTVKGGSGLDELFGQKGADRLIGGGGSDLAKGGAGADVLIGGKGSDELFGGGGADRILGGKGGDLMVGGGGADIFVLRPGDGEDEIDRFVPGTDILDLAPGVRPEISVEPDGLHLDLGRGDGLFLIGLDAADAGALF